MSRPMNKNRVEWQRPTGSGYNSADRPPKTNFKKTIRNFKYWGSQKSFMSNDVQKNLIRYFGASKIHTSALQPRLDPKPPPDNVERSRYKRWWAGTSKGRTSPKSRYWPEPKPETAGHWHFVREISRAPPWKGSQTAIKRLLRPNQACWMPPACTASITTRIHPESTTRGHLISKPQEIKIATGQLSW